MTAQQPTKDSVRITVERDQVHLKESLDALTEVIDKYSGDDGVLRADSSVRELKKIARSVSEHGEEMLQKTRLLRLGIVGQVKAGKSSLLNLLLFDGQNVLPEAATPMTASLTHIVNSDRDEIEIEYYTPEDWEEIDKHAHEYKRAKEAGDLNVEPFMKAAAHLVEMANERRLNVHDHLGKKDVHEMPKAQLNEKLRRFVGSDGDLTPLVKSVTIRSSQGKPDLDIVDTPGINDPIVSRSWQTERMLARCDAVLLLSYVGSFMESADVEFFKDRIPQEGIRCRFVLGSKLDSALVDVSKEHSGMLDEAMDDMERVKARATGAVVGLDDALVTNDRPVGEVVFMSAMCAILAAKPSDSWASGERYAFDTLQRAYPDWLDQSEVGEDINQATRDVLARIGNRAAVQKVLEAVRADKDNIMAGKMKAFLREKRARVRHELVELIDDLEKRRATVEDGDIEGIEKQSKSIDALREELETRVTRVWEDLVGERGAHFVTLSEKIKEEVAETRREIQETVTTDTMMKREEKKGGWNAIKRWVADADSAYRNKQYEEKVLDDLMLKNSIDSFCESIQEEVGKVVDEMYDSRFKAEAVKVLRKAVADSFSNDLAANIDIDMVALRRSLREAISRIVEAAEERLSKARKSLFNEMDLSFSYEGDSPEGGQSEGSKFVKAIRDRVNNWLESCKEQIDAVQSQAKEDLVPATVDELRDFQDRLKKEIKDKEFTLQRYGLALDELRHASVLLGNSAGTNGG